MSQTLILFSNSFPYTCAKEHTFLSPEIKYLVKSFKRVIIVPFRVEGEKVPLPEGVEIEETLYLECCPKNELERIRLGLSVLLSTLFFQEITSRPRTLLQPAAMKRLVATISIADKTCRWVCNFIKYTDVDLKRTIFYTYWRNEITLGLGLAKRIFPDLKLISRLHGGDVYEIQHVPPYLPCLPETLERIDRLFAVSEMGKEYVGHKFPWMVPRCEVSRLGTEDPGSFSRRSKDGVFRMASCAFIVPMKRIHLLVRALEQLGKLRRDRTFEWYHMGDGPLMGDVVDLAERILPVNVKCHFLGNVPNEKVYSFYKENMIDLYVNVSLSEGVPVSIMEAQSCAIPVMATRVGGMPDIVSEENGVLLRPDPSAGGIAFAIAELIDNPEMLTKKRAAARATWEGKYNAAFNFPAFAGKVKSLMDGEN